MKKEELEKLNVVLKKIGNMSDILSSKVYDFETVKLDDEFLNFLLSDKIDMEFKKLKEKKFKQDSILSDAMEHVSFKYYQCNILCYKCKIVEYEKYYFVKIVGSPFEQVELIYYKNGELLNFVSKNSGWIDVIDDENYFILDKKKHIAIHKMIDSTCTSCNNVRVFGDVYSHVLPVFAKKIDAKFSDLIGWTKINNINQEKNVLYDYQTRCILIPEYTDVSYDYGCFANMIDKDGLVRIINSINYCGFICNLEFLIDKDGILCTDIHDFSRNICYKRDTYMGSQSEVLNSIYEQVKLELGKKVKEKLNSNNLVKSRCLKK